MFERTFEVLLEILEMVKDTSVLYGSAVHGGVKQRSFRRSELRIEPRSVDEVQTKWRADRNSLKKSHGITKAFFNMRSDPDSI